VQNTLIGRVTGKYVNPEIDIGPELLRQRKIVIRTRCSPKQQGQETPKSSFSCHLD
jgi:hypothetical protein